MSTPIYNKIITQIYEIQTPYEAEMLSDIGVDHIGSVLTSKQSLRQSLLKETIELVRKSNSKSSLIPLFSDIDSILQALDFYKPDIVHFCEDLYQYKNSSGLDFLVGLQKKVREKFPAIDIMRSIPIPQGGIPEPVSSIELAKLFEETSDYFLTDTFVMNNTCPVPDDQPVNGFVGITGITCNWDSARKFVDSTDIPVILAGGLSPDNVFEGIIKVKPAGVDSCTHTNTLDMKGSPVRFKKDMARVKRFVEESKRAQKELLERIGGRKKTEKP
jgi:phosphoribosylanthranilate isomerase